MKRVLRLISSEKCTSHTKRGMDTGGPLSRPPQCGMTNEPTIHGSLVRASARLREAWLDCLLGVGWLDVCLTLILLGPVGQARGRLFLWLWREPKRAGSAIKPTSTLCSRPRLQYLPGHSKSQSLALGQRGPERYYSPSGKAGKETFDKPV